SMTGVEWAISDLLVKLGRELQAKEILCLEGVASPMLSEKVKCYYYSSSNDKKKVFDKIKIEPMREGIILGVTGALMLETERIPISCIFAETHSSLPDSKAAAAVIEVLDKYLGLKVDVKPLMQQAEKFEEKIKKIVEQGKAVSEEQKKKKLWYVG
ncbi:PAC2 family protein, partial [Candidatus Woesearchaeota archaeon]|nr:PAC2 family protein [Candidatus Woesearchaeota archaeon]